MAQDEIRIAITPHWESGRLSRVGLDMEGLRRTTCLSGSGLVIRSPQRSAWRMAVLLPLSAPEPTPYPTLNNGPRPEAPLAKLTHEFYRPLPQDPNGLRRLQPCCLLQNDPIARSA